MTIYPIAQANPPPGVIDFGLGQPDPALWPLSLLRQAADHRLSQGDGALLAYGIEPGDGYFREALAQFLSQGYGVPVDPEHLMVSNGNSQALDFVCTHFSQPGDTVFVEEPTYFLALQILADYHLNIVSIPVDPHGLRLDVLEAKLAEHQPTFLYTIPTFHNPTGVTLSAERRVQLIRLSEQHNFLIVADEVYQLLWYTTPPPPPLMHYDQAGTVISLGTFSKILAPGLRLGWIQARPERLAPLLASGMVESGGGLNPFTTGIVRSVLELGLQTEYLTYLRQTYRNRLSVLAQALHEEVPGFSFIEPAGGYFIWGSLAQEVDTQVLLVPAAQGRVAFQPGVKSSSNGGLRNYLRLSFAYYDEAQLREGVRRLAGVAGSLKRIGDCVV